MGSFPERGTRGKPFAVLNIAEDGVEEKICVVKVSEYEGLKT